MKSTTARINKRQASDSSDFVGSDQNSLSILGVDSYPVKVPKLKHQPKKQEVVSKDDSKSTMPVISITNIKLQVTDHTVKKYPRSQEQAKKANAKRASQATGVGAGKGCTDSWIQPEDDYLMFLVENNFVAWAGGKRAWGPAADRFNSKNLGPYRTDRALGARYAEILTGPEGGVRFPHSEWNPDMDRLLFELWPYGEAEAASAAEAIKSQFGSIKTSGAVRARCKIIGVTGPREILTGPGEGVQNPRARANWTKWNPDMNHLLFKLWPYGKAEAASAAEAIKSQFGVVKTAVAVRAQCNVLGIKGKKK